MRFNLIDGVVGIEHRLHRGTAHLVDDLRCLVEGQNHIGLSNRKGLNAEGDAAFLEQRATERAPSVKLLTATSTGNAPSVLRWNGEPKTITPPVPPSGRRSAQRSTSRLTKSQLPRRWLSSGRGHMQSLWAHGEPMQTDKLEAFGHNDVAHLAAALGGKHTGVFLQCKRCDLDAMPANLLQ